MLKATNTKLADDGDMGPQARCLYSAAANLNKKKKYTTSFNAKIMLQISKFQYKSASCCFSYFSLNFNQNMLSVCECQIRWDAAIRGCFDLKIFFIHPNVMLFSL